MEKSTLLLVLMLLLLSSATFVSLVKPVEIGPSITLTKTPSATLVESGSAVSYLYNVTNTGETALTGSIYDDVYGTVGNYVNLQPGGWVGFNITHTITDNTTNIATAYGVDASGANVTATASATVEVYYLNSSLLMKKTPSATLVESGSAVSYLYNVTNTGETALTGSIYDDVYGTVGNYVNLQPGGWVGFNITHTITDNTTNIATAYGVDKYGRNITSTDTATVEVYYLNSSLLMKKTPSATLVESGSAVSYLYNVTNTGETALTGSIYDDVYGTVGNYVNLQPGGWVGFNITHTITDNTTNIATAYGVDKYGRNITSTDTAFVQVPSPKISVTKTGDPVTQLAPGTITWNVTVTNVGGYSLTEVNVTDTRHGYLGSVGQLDPGQTIFFVIVESGLPPGTYYDNATALATSKFGTVSDSGDATCIVCSGNSTIESCNSAGVKKDIFLVGDDVYANGECYRPQTTYDIYVVEDVTWVDGMAIPPRVPGTTTTVTTDVNGNIPPTLLWTNPLEPGKYDIIVDVDGDGLYYAETDTLDDNDIKVTAGYFVVPEVPLGTITATLSMFGALIGFTKFKRSRPQLQLK